MAIVLASIVALHVVAFLGVMLLAKFSVALVDDQGKPLGHPSPWQERIVSSCPAPASQEA